LTLLAQKRLLGIHSGHSILKTPIPNSNATATQRVLAIDPSLRGTGYAVLEKVGTKVRALTYGTIKNSPNLLPSGCLVAINERVVDLIATHKPDCAAFEGVIFVQSYRTAITLGAARGAALVAAAGRGLPIYEYAPRRVKQAVVGRGGAEKGQVGFMVRALLGLTETPAADAADALAIGLTHFNMASTAGLGATVLERI
jgi:crossover junction endodeoxyribonuclease RuvC